MEMGIVLYSDVGERQPWLGKVPCPRTGKSLQDVLKMALLFTSLTEDTLDHYFIEGRRSNVPTINPDPVPPGVYTIRRPTRADRAEADVRCGLLTDVGQLLRSIEFMKNLCQRDCACVVTGQCLVDELKASHIVPFAWEGLLDMLPFEVADAIRRHGGIDSVHNGLLLEYSLSTSFDKGQWGILRDESGAYRAFAISGPALRREIDGMPLHGHAIRMPEGTTPEGIAWSDLFPLDLLFEFHFTASVLKFCASEVPAYDFEDDFDPASILSSEGKFADYLDQLVEARGFY
ncbi:hypothetical protein HK104_010496 [Borealophlyctis nickersoniae]|nr:hypothetical protein HK104_010496 [Borealophlyctis nickersoniae]